MITPRVLLIPLLLLFVDIGAGGCFAKHVVRPVAEVDHTKRGLYYALPRTLILVDLPITKTTTSRSRLVASLTPEELETVKARVLAEFGELVFDQENPNETITLGTPKILLDSEPDPENVFFIELRGGFFTTGSFAVQLRESGVIRSADSSVADESLPFLIKTVETAASVFGKAVGMRMAIDKAKVKPNWEKVVEAITRLRSRRLDLITGQAAQARLSAEALDRMLREIDALDAELLSNFTGQVSTSEGSLRARIFVPRECLAQDLVIVTMKDAIVTLGDLSQKCNKPGNKQEQIYAQLTFSALPAEFRSGVPSDADSTMLTLQLAADPREEKQLATVVSQHVTTGERSYYYRIPVSARANVSALNYVCPREHRRIKEKKPTCDKSLTSIKSELAIERVAIAHLGHVASLPPHLGSLNSKFVPTFDEATGALTAITISTTGVSTESLTSLGTAAESVVTATGARQKASRERTNEIARLKAEADALEQQKRIKELQKELDQLNQ